MKNKKVFIPIIIVFALALIGLVYHFLTKEDKDTTLNLIEKQWIESNKNDVIFMSILNNIPVLSYNGEGLIIEFLDSLNNDTNLSFNKESYKLGTDATTDYAFKLVDEIGNNDLLIYKDNYVIASKDKKSYRSLSDLNDLQIGVLSSNLDSVNNYLIGANVTYKTYDTKDALLAEYSKVDTELDGIVLLKTCDLESIIKNNYTINYNITEYTKSLVLSLGNTEKLNNILTKYYNKWANDNYDAIYNKYLAKNYLTFKGITDAEAVKFRSKKYYYGYIENGPYDMTNENKLSGVNANLLSDFSNFSKAVIHYQKYDSIYELINSFNSNSIDFFYGINENGSYNIDVYNTVSSYNNSYVVLTNLNNNLTINSLKSLNNVVSISDSYINQKLFNITKNYPNIDELLKNIKDDSIIIMDLNSYTYYKNKLSNYIISYQFDAEDVNFRIRDISDNKIFSEMFDFYISFSTNNYVNNGLNELLSISKTPFILKRVAVILGSLVVILLVTLSIMKLKPKDKKKVNLSKEDKLRYIDALTSLKNRNYLNDSVERWDNSEIYPQAIIIVDLNNVAYINDNYGHAEGDAIIKQAANILILNQIENSEIIRTNGNEFLIYLVSTEEKQVITYMRKLNKELKELDHGFGAALGYSMINDAIKTVDDAINEATLDMRNNKEEAQ